MSRRKKSNPRTLAVVIQDKSSSMNGIASSTISGYNEYLDTLGKDKDAEILVTLTQFNEGVKNVYTSIPVAEAARLNSKTYIASGSTALYDAIGATVRKVEKTAKPNDNVVVIIMTDGEENSSTEYTQSAIFDMFEKKRKIGWDFVFLGAGEESWDAGQKLGFKYADTITYDSTPMEQSQVFRGMATNTSFLAKEGKEAYYGSMAITKTGIEEGNEKTQKYWEGKGELPEKMHKVK